MSVMVSDHQDSGPTHDIAEERIVSIEHPCLVKNFDNGLKSLGGEQQLKDVIENKVGDSIKSNRTRTYSEPTAAVSLRPNDPFSKKIVSTAAETDNVLLKVTVPKRTGRKRKRGSDEPFTHSTIPSQQNDSVSGFDLLQRLRDKPDRYAIEVVGTIEETHSFRSLPDLQVRAEDVPIMRELRDHAMSSNFEDLKRFSIDVQQDAETGTAFSGPPSFFPLSVAHTHENQSARNATNAKGYTISKIRKRPTKVWSMGISFANGVVPQHPPSDLGTPSGLHLEKAIESMKQLLEVRPIVTLRAANCLIPESSVKAIAQVVPYVGYFLNDGPWFETIVKYGVDPRKDSKYRFFQTVKFLAKQVRVHLAAMGYPQDEGQAHVFGGDKLLYPGHIWQICDLTDNILQEVINTDEIRSGCAESDNGWYYNGTMAKTHVIMDDKMKRLMKGEKLLSDGKYKALSALPNQINDAADLLKKQSFGDSDVSILAKRIINEAIKSEDFWIGDLSGTDYRVSSVGFEEPPEGHHNGVEDEGDEDGEASGDENTRQQHDPGEESISDEENNHSDNEDEQMEE